MKECEMIFVVLLSSHHHGNALNLLFMIKQCCWFVLCAGACGGELACSTCHLIFDQEVYDTLPPKSDEEEDMLDLAFELTETSRLGCQINVTKEFEGIKVRIPDDGY